MPLRENPIGFGSDPQELANTLTENFFGMVNNVLTNVNQNINQAIFKQKQEV